MGVMIKALSEQLIPTILILVGLFLIILAFVRPLKEIIKVPFIQQRTVGLIGIFLVVMGLVLNLNSLPQNQVKTSLTQNNCSALFFEGNVINWKIKNYGKLGNAGTLEIKNMDAVTGNWIGEQITQTKNNIKIRVTGKIDGFTMSLIHPSGAESWFGICQNRTIEGSIETTYDSQLTFEMQS